jgi:type IV secretory pathway TrbL component
MLMFLAFGVLGAMLSSLCDLIQAWALIAFILPTLLGRQVLLWRTPWFVAILSTSPG